MINFDSKLDIKTMVTVISLAVIGLFGLFKLTDTVRVTAAAVELITVSNKEQHLGITDRLSALERAALVQQGYNSALAEMVAEKPKDE